MKTKQFVDIIIEGVLLLFGLVIMILGIVGYSKIKVVFVSALFTYAIFNFIQFYLTRKSKDMEGLYTALASILVGIADLYFPFTNNVVLPVSIMVWSILMSIIKVIKADYYNDRRDRVWKFKMVSLCVFMVISVLTSVALNYNNNVQVLIIGYFFVINGILELSEPIVKYLLGK
ncbi:MAG: hypothetical protein E7159_03315 [Firmicutes bacterium]|nr:hypothetical protein [Bacillota bacterium]